MTEFKLNGVAYQAGKLDAIKQFHVVRRLAPVVAALAGEDLSALRAGQMESVLPAIAEAVSAMPDANVDYVLNACLGVVSRDTGSGRGFAPIYGRGGMMFDDIDMGVMMQLVWRVLEADLEGFFAALPRPSPDAPAA